jgi:hypothetical protein
VLALSSVASRVLLFYTHPYYVCVADSTMDTREVEYLARGYTARTTRGPVELPYLGCPTFTEQQRNTKQPGAEGSDELSQGWGLERDDGRTRPARAQRKHTQSA